MDRPAPTTPWRLSADVGGTFTDAIARDPTGRVHSLKLLSTGRLRVLATPSTDPCVVRVGTAAQPDLWIGARAAAGSRESSVRGADPALGLITLAEPVVDAPGAQRPATFALDLFTGEPAPVLAARLLTGTPSGSPLPPMVLRLATTRATNALLEGRLPLTALLVTEGFGDVLEIGDQRRPRLFDLDIRRPAPLTRLVFEIPGRLDARGGVLRPLDIDAVQRAADEAIRRGARAAAVALMHSWINPEHEHAVRDLLLAAGMTTVIASSDLAARVRLLVRAQSATIEAALSAIVGGYLRDIDSALGAGDRFALTSAGSLSRFDSFRPVDALLSGPAGGVVGSLAAARRSGVARVLAFDMGGTSTDASRLEGGPTLCASHAVAHITIPRPAVEIETVAAGGGSICAWRDSRLCVGPESAGADPGPACYGRGGPLTITDADLLLGRIDTTHAPTPLDLSAARAAAERAWRDARAGGSAFETVEALLEALADVADAAMAEAIRTISARRGYDPTDYALLAYGGAGPQHACALATHLGMRAVLIPAQASLLSAVGVDAAQVERDAEQQVLEPLDALLPHDDPGAPTDRLTPMLDALAEHALCLMRRDTGEGLPARITRTARLRVLGQEATVEFDARDPRSLRPAFLEHARRVWGAPPEKPIEVESISARVARSSPTDTLDAERDAGPGTTHDPAPSGKVPVFHAGRWIEAARFERCSLASGARINGPALVAEPTTTAWIPAGWSGRIDTAGALALSQEGEPAPRLHGRDLRRELLVRRLAGIAESMGEVLARTALSTNIRERLDLSCGVLDAEGRLVASAPHIPVHLGALGACVRAVLDHLGPLAPGSAALTNHPAFGGSHLPDVTIIQPVYLDDGTLVGYVASRAHHAEIGGLTPGSMPPGARSLEEEGVVLAPMRLAQNDDLRALRRALTTARYPTRAVEENLADVRAALAAGRHAADELRQLAGAAEPGALPDAMRWIIDHTSALVRDALRRQVRWSGPRQATDALDDGSRLAAEIELRDDTLLVSFEGTSAEHGGNLNSPLAVTRSAVAYVLRLLVQHDVPLNDGLLEPVQLHVPPRTILNPCFAPEPAACPAVAAGNTETSQRVVELLLRAFGVLAGSQGTMNNLLFGDDTFGYYETIAGGAGAGPGFAGASAVQVHMTNTATTDAELLEQRFPVRLERFSLRRGSGGRGQWPGGDGVERAIVALRPLRGTIISQRRVRGAPGCEGGGDGAPGSQHIERAYGAREPLDPSADFTLGPGDRLVILTPGGGAWGAELEADRRSTTGHAGSRSEEGPPSAGLHGC